MLLFLSNNKSSTLVYHMNLKYLQCTGFSAWSTVHLFLLGQSCLELKGDYTLQNIKTENTSRLPMPVCTLQGVRPKSKTSV